MHKENRLIFGCGYLGRRVARRWIAQGHAVSAVTRSQARGEDLARESITPIIGDISLPPQFPDLPPFDAVLFAVGFDRSTGHSIHEVYVGGLLNAVRALAAHCPRRFVYVSSTGVYGDAGGEWINEESPCDPIREGGKACLAAESMLSASPLGPASIILRLAGLYGPGRLPRKADLLAGLALTASESGYLNLIHVDDAAAAVDLALEKSESPRLYLVTDGSPAKRGDYYREVALQLNAPPPQFDPNAISSRIARAASDKRVCSARIVRELGFAPRYGSYREGIAASLRNEHSGD